MRCRICESEVVTDTVPYRNEGRHKNEIFDGLRVVVCSACHSSWVENPPTVEQLQTYYEEHYVPGQMKHIDKDSWPIWDGRPASLIVLSRLFTEFNPGDFFIDVGPGNGAALSLAPYLLPTPRLGCVEYNRKSIRFFSRHLPRAIVKGSVNSFVDEYGPEAVRMIYSAHCLEHFRPDDLDRELGTLYRALSRSGVLAIEVPYGGVARMMASNHSPHLVFFTPDGLTHLLRKAGFDVRLCFTAVGRTHQGQKYVDRFFPIPSDDVAGDEFAARISALNIADFIGKVPRKAGGAVIKCISTKGTEP